MGDAWRVDKTYARINGQWKYPYCTVDRLRYTVELPLTARRDEVTARQFFERTIDRYDEPRAITIDKSGTDTAAVNGVEVDSGVLMEFTKSKFANNIVEQDHRAIKRRLRPMRDFKRFDSAAKIIAGFETMHVTKKGQLQCPGGLPFSDADYFCSLAAR